MIKSMTGYGSAKGTVEGMEIRVELKSVNNRYLDTAVRLPRSFLFAEEMVKTLVQKHISRGKVDVFVNVDSSAAGDMTVKVNEGLLKGYIDAIRHIAVEYGLADDLTAQSVSRFPDVLAVEKKDLDADAISAGMEAIVMLSRSVMMRALLDSVTGTRVAVTFTLSIVSVRDWATTTPANNPASRKTKAIMTSFFIAGSKGTDLSVVMNWSWNTCFEFVTLKRKIPHPTKTHNIEASKRQEITTIADAVLSVPGMLDASNSCLGAETASHNSSASGRHHGGEYQQLLR